MSNPASVCSTFEKYTLHKSRFLVFVVFAFFAILKYLSQFESLSGIITSAIAVLPFVLVAAVLVWMYFKDREDHALYQALQGCDFFLKMLFKLSAAILILFVAFFPSAWLPLVGFLKSLRNLISLENYFLLSSYLAIGIVTFGIIHFFVRLYQIGQGTYRKSLSHLIRKSLYSTFLLLLVILLLSILSYPRAYTPITDAVSDAIYTASQGLIAIPKLSGENLQKVDSLFDLAAGALTKTKRNINSEIADTKSNLLTSIQESQSSLSQSISQTSNNLNQAINEKVSTTGGDITGDLTINNSDLTVDGDTTTNNILPSGDGSYDLGSSDKAWDTLYVRQINGDPSITFNSSLIPSSAAVNLGSASNHFGTVYADNLVGVESSQWTTSGTDIYYNLGRVGIGTTSLGDNNALDVSGTVAIGENYVGYDGLPSNSLIVENRIGIGTTDPSHTFTVQQKDFDDYQLFLKQSNANHGYVMRSSAYDGDLSFARKVDDTITETVRFTADGSVGIGTTSPEAKLDVKGNAIVSGKFGVGTTDPNGLFMIGDENADITSTAYVISDTQLENGYADAYPRANAFDDDETESIIYSPDGTTFPTWIGQDFGAGNEKVIGRYTIMSYNVYAPRGPKDWTFEASNTCAWDDTVVLDSQAGISWGVREKKTYDISNQTAYRCYRINVSDTEDSIFLIITEIEMMARGVFVFADGGNVGIGVTDPGSKLEINDNATTGKTNTGILTVYADKDGNATGNLDADLLKLDFDPLDYRGGPGNLISGWRYGSKVFNVSQTGSLTTQGELYVPTTSSLWLGPGTSFRLYDDGTYSHIMTNDDSDRDLYINTGATKTVILDGKLTVPGTLTLSGLADGSLSVVGGVVTSSSDERKKDKISDIDSVLDKVLKLDPLIYTWKTSTPEGQAAPNKEQIGFFAQDMEKYFPQLVGTNDEGMKGLNYSGYTAVLTRAIQEQQATIDKLSEQIKTDSINQTNLATTLQTQIENLKTQIANLDPLQQSAQLDLNTQDIAYLKQLLGITDTSKPGDVSIVGQFTASGMETGKLTISIIDTAAPTIGTATIKAGEISITVQTKAVTKDSGKIFVTPIGGSPVTWIVDNIKDGESFDVVVDKAAVQDVKFNWWIVDKK